MKHVLTIDDQTYVYILKNNNLSIRPFKEGYEQDFSTQFVKDEKVLINQTINVVFDMVKKTIEKNIKENKYISFDDIQKDFDKNLGDIKISDLPQLNDYNYKDNPEYKKVLKQLEDIFKNNIKTEDKKEIIEEKMDIDLDNIFKDRGISEYKISDSKNIITYEKNGVTYTMCNMDPNKSIYDYILKHIDSEALESESKLNEEIDKGIREAEVEHTLNKNIKSSEADRKLKELAEQIKKDYNLSEVNIVKSPDPNYIENGFVVDFGKGPQLITATENSKTGKYEIEFPKQKEIHGNTESNNQQISKSEENKDLNLTNDDNLRDILIKMELNQDLTNDDIKVIEYYMIEENFYNLKPENREIAQQLVDQYQMMNQPKEKDEKKEEKGNAYVLKPYDNSDQHAIASMGMIYILCAIATILFLILLIKIFIGL